MSNGEEAWHYRNTVSTLRQVDLPLDLPNASSSENAMIPTDENDATFDLPLSFLLELSVLGLLELFPLLLELELFAPFLSSSLLVILQLNQ